jgi:hypothetical protein
MTEWEAIQLLRANTDGTPQMTHNESGLPANNEPENRPEVIREKTDSEENNSEGPDVLPAPLNALFASLWVLLFGGRWLLVPLLQAAGVVSMEQVAAWDEGLLYKTYLILLFLTCIVLALRAARAAQKPKLASP